LLLSAIEAHLHAQVPLGQGNGIQRRPFHASRLEQVGDDPVQHLYDVFSGEVVHKKSYKLQVTSHKYK
ncbi:MAG TPA: hypothetical protein VG013_11910, partial [Gemmataceae bacterium]|nr:hypothetical protein [Gemmataceae bacterium]